ncbi:MAG: ribosome biogenesis GTPase Der [Rhodospirillaceae bacterium]|nr:MAG: ribosome biogenesis GTPase Der [Rhodospirillaceae bacterium]
MARRSRTSRTAAATPGAFTVAIVGRPNVGKSTLFNRLSGRRVALVHDRPGVTRDRRIGQGAIADLSFTVIDTAGFEDAKAETLEGRMRRQTEKAVADADVVLMLVDARAGITPFDEHFAALLRKSRTPVILVANKCEGAVSSALLDAYRLGLGDALPISAEHGEGLDGLYRALAPFAPPETVDDGDNDGAPAPVVDGTAGDEESADDESRPLQLAIVGRPNSGKSTLVNRLIGEERVLTGPEPGVTRDAIYIDWTHEGRLIRLVDTAGVRRRARITDAVEKLSVTETFDAIRLAEVVVLLVDAESPLDNQEMTLARHAVEEGRALVVAVNKWDLVKNRNEVLAEMKIRLGESLAQVRGVPLVTLSAKTGAGVETLMKAVFKIHRVWNTRVGTASLNRWLGSVTAAHPPPLSVHKQRIKLRFMSQTKTRPPTFAIFSTRAGDLPDAYMRYLTNGLRDAFGLDGVPIRIALRKPKNPYADDEK